MRRVSGWLGKAIGSRLSPISQKRTDPKCISRKPIAESRKLIAFYARSPSPIRSSQPDDLGLPFVAVDDRAVLQIQSHLERPKLGFDCANCSRAGVADGAIWPSSRKQPRRTRRLRLAVYREWAVFAAPAV